MRFFAFELDGEPGLAVDTPDGLRGEVASRAGTSVDLVQLVAGGTDTLARAARRLADGRPVPASARRLPPLVRPRKVICIGLNYADHTSETAMAQPEWPTVFFRYASSLVADGAAIVKPYSSDTLDFEGEMVAVIGKPGRRIPRARALEHVIGWSIFNEASVRDVQFRTPQWALGKNFDATGAFGPSFVTADEVPLGGKGLKIETRLNGAVVQSSSTDQMIFDVPTIMEMVSEGMTLESGDLIITGTPSGCGFWRKPQLFMRAGDTVEVEIEGLGVLRNPIAEEARPLSLAA